jgi:tungstate transport system substrate-binding protein
MHIIPHARGKARTSAPSDRKGGLYRLILPLAGLASAVALMLAPSIANADTSKTLTVLGTSDVSDSALIQNVIGPDFKSAFPQYTFKYIGSATGTAIDNAKAGTGGPSALIVHAASLENSFVADGFSYKNQYGNAIFTNDFVVAGSTADPAGVLTGAPHNVAQAFADIAKSGAAGDSVFYTRGGTTTASGTTVEEHALWQLMKTAGLTPSGVFLCTVSAADGGGMSPTISTYSGMNCPSSGTVDSSTAPAWYFINSGANQGANVTATNACTLAGNGANCYSLTDRGTFNNLSGSASTANSNTIANLKIVNQTNSATAPGGANELVNYFHVYIINPSKPGQTVNLPAAQDFVSLLTSPTFQAQLPSYLSNTNAGGPTVFHGTASPSLTAKFSPASVTTGQKVTVTGQLTNKEPGYPVLNNVPVTVNQVLGTVPVKIAQGTTNATGGYSISFTPSSSGSYSVSTGQISKIENATLNPKYGDILVPASTAASKLSVTGAVSITKTTTSAGGIQVSGNLAPAAPDANATVTLLAKQPGASSWAVVGSENLAKGQNSYAVAGTGKGGTWSYQVRYADPGALTTAASATQSVTVPNTSVAVKFKKVSVKQGKLTVSGSVGQAPANSGAKVQLFALVTGKVSKSKSKPKKGQKPKQSIVRIDAKSSGAKFKKVVGKTLKPGTTTYTLKHKLKRGQRYALQLKYVNAGQTTTYSGFKYVSVH